MEMLPIETESFKDDGVMVGLWRQCIRYLPDKYECYENLNQNIEDNDDPLCKFAINQSEFHILAKNIYYDSYAMNHFLNRFPGQIDIF